MSTRSAFRRSPSRCRTSVASSSPAFTTPPSAHRRRTHWQPRASRPMAWSSTARTRRAASPRDPAEGRHCGLQAGGRRTIQPGRRARSLITERHLPGVLGSARRALPTPGSSAPRSTGRECVPAARGASSSRKYRPMLRAQSSMPLIRTTGSSPAATAVSAVPVRSLGTARRVAAVPRPCDRVARRALSPVIRASASRTSRTIGSRRTTNQSTARSEYRMRFGRSCRS